MSKNKYKYNLGDRIYFSFGSGVEGWGKICGCSSDHIEEVGRGWIVEIEEEGRRINKTVYPFTHIVVFDIAIKEPPTEQKQKNKTDGV